jgi:hypothetical protein
MRQALNLPHEREEISVPSKKMNRNIFCYALDTGSIKGDSDSLERNVGTLARKSKISTEVA